MIQPGDHPYFFPVRNRRFSLWRNGGEKIIKKIQRFLKRKGHEFLDWWPMSTLHKERNNPKKFQNLGNCKLLEHSDLTTDTRVGGEGLDQN